MTFRNRVGRANRRADWAVRPATKDAALLAMADALAKAETAILEANEHDVSAPRRTAPARR